MISILSPIVWLFVSKCLCFFVCSTSIGFLRNFVIRLDCTLIGRCRWKLEVGGIGEHSAITFEEFFNFSVTVTVTAVPQ